MQRPCCLRVTNLQVRSELSPWERQMQEVQSRMDVATSERDLLLKQHEEAKQRLTGMKEQLQEAQKVAAAKEKEIQQIQREMEAVRLV